MTKRFGGDLLICILSGAARRRAARARILRLEGPRRRLPRAMPSGVQSACREGCMPGGSGVHAGRVKWAVAEAPPSAVHPHPWAAPETYGLLDRRVTSTTPPGKTKWALPCDQTVREGQMGCPPCYQTGNLLSFFPPPSTRGGSYYGHQRQLGGGQPGPSRFSSWVSSRVLSRTP